MIRAGVDGGAFEARRIARAARKAAVRDLSREIRQGVLDATKLLHPLLVVSASGYMPSGYGPTLASDIRVKTTTKLAVSRGVAVTVTIFASGKGSHRDVARINAGELRHPVFGRRRMTKRGPRLNPWVGQRVRPRFVDDPVDQFRPDAIRRVDAAASRVAEKIERA